MQRLIEDPVAEAVRPAACNPATIASHACNRSHSRVRPYQPRVRPVHPGRPRPSVPSLPPPNVRQVLDGYCAGGTLQLDADTSGNLLMRNSRGQQRVVEMREGAVSACC